MPVWRLCRVLSFLAQTNEWIYIEVCRSFKYVFSTGGIIEK